MASTAFHAKSTALEIVKGLNAKLDDKIVLITGATSGKKSIENFVLEIS